MTLRDTEAKLWCCQLYTVFIWTTHRACAQVEDVRLTRIDAVLDEISAYLLFDNNSLERLTLEEFAAQMIDFTRLCATDVAGKSYRVEESLSELVAMLYRRATNMLKECVEVTTDTNGALNQFLLIFAVIKWHSSFWETYLKATERHLTYRITGVTCHPTQLNAARYNLIPRLHDQAGSTSWLV